MRSSTARPRRGARSPREPRRSPGRPTARRTIVEVAAVAPSGLTRHRSPHVATHPLAPRAATAHRQSRSVHAGQLALSMLCDRSPAPRSGGPIGCSSSSEGGVCRGPSRPPETAGFVGEQRSRLARLLRPEQAPRWEPGHTPLVPEAGSRPRREGALCMEFAAVVLPAEQKSGPWAPPRPCERPTPGGGDDRKRRV
jgi:hypothetical protein